MLRTPRMFWSVAVCFLLPFLARGQEVKFLPDKPLNYASVDFAAFMKSQTYADLQKEIPPLKQALENKLVEQLGIPVANIARISIGLAYGDQGEEVIGFVRTIAPVKWMDLKATRNSSFRVE